MLGRDAFGSFASGGGLANDEALRTTRQARLVLDSDMGDEAGDDDRKLLEACLKEFQSQVMRTLLQLAVDRPELVREGAVAIRGKLDALVMAVGDPVDDSPSPRTLAPSTGAPAGINGAGAAPTSEPPRSPVKRFEGLGRNQRSRIRELVVLEMLAHADGAVTIDELVSVIKTEGFDDTAAAVVSQLHRLKKLGIIDQPVNGLYEITSDGLAHTRKLRTTFGPFLKP